MPAPVQTVVDEGDSLRTVAEAGSLLRIGVTKTYELINSGHLEAVRLGKKATRIRMSSITRLIKHGVREAA